MPKKKRGHRPNLIEARHFYTFVETGEIYRREVDIVDRSEIGTSADEEEFQQRPNKIKGGK